MRKFLLAGVVVLSLVTPAMADEQDDKLRHRIEIQHAHCDNVTKPQITESLEHGVYMLDRNAKVLDMTIEFDELLGVCFSQVITDHAGKFTLVYSFVTLNGKGYINIKRIGP